MSKEKIEYVWTAENFVWQYDEVIKLGGISAQVHCYKVARVCDVCDQAAMRDSLLCADCRTVAEEVQQNPGPATLSQRPADSLRDWITRPCGTITDRGAQ